MRDGTMTTAIDLENVPADVAFEHAFDMHYTLELTSDVGATPFGRRILFTTKGGRFGGPAIDGEILAGGTDWTRVSDDGRAHIDAKLVMKTHDGALIRASWLGRMHADLASLVKIATPQTRATIDPDKVYFRVSPLFETAAPAYDWLNRSVFVATARFTKTGISYRVLRVV